MAGKLAAQLAGAAVEAVGAAHGIPGLGQPAETLVRELLRVQDEQAESLRRIDQNVQRLVDAPWRAARVHLEECLLPGRTPAQLAGSLHKAADLLRYALGQQSPGTISAAYVALDLAMVLVLLDDCEASRYYARVAIEAGTEHLMRFAKTVRSVGQAEHDAAEEWYWLANAVAAICRQEGSGSQAVDDGWPRGQFSRIQQEGSYWLINTLEHIAIGAWNRGEVHSGWDPRGRYEYERWRAASDYLGE